jgi:small subunit ribosomal protein S2
MEENKEEIVKESPVSDFGLRGSDEMTEAGLHFGHRKSKVHPKMKQYIFTVKNGVHIIDLDKTKEKLNEALDFIKKTVSEEKTILLVGTKIQFKNLVKEIAQEAEIPYITKRWLGGTFTNFRTIRKRIDYFKELREKKDKGDLEKYTKKERLNIDRELDNLEEKFGGIKNMDKLPEAVFVLDMKKDGLAIKEARAKGIKVIAIADTNMDPSLADYVIPANDDAISSVKYILEKVKDVIIKNRK